jgi:predicted outer membrane lipoprotein
MNKAPTSLGGGPIHHLSGIRKPGRPHYHSFSALPVNFALLDALVFEVVEQAARQQRQQRC